MRKIAALMMCMLLLLGMGVTAFADDVIIDTTVPEFHTITVLADGADVFLNGERGSSFTVGRLSEPKLLIRAQRERNRSVKQVLLDDTDITSEVRGGYVVLPPMCQDRTLTVLTEQTPDEAKSKAYTCRGTVMRNGSPVPGITLELRSVLKTHETDSEGKFSFEDVACGKNSLTVLENGKIVGYIEFVLEDSGQTAYHLTDSGVYAITANGKDIGIDLVLNLTEQDTITIESVTGVRGNMTFRIILIIVICVCVILLVITAFIMLKKRKHRTTKK